MSIFDDIGNALKGATNAVANTAESAANTVANAAEAAYDDAKGVAENLAWAVADGANLMVGGWQQVFSGNVLTGIASVGVSLAEIAGLAPAQAAQSYENAVGVASLWALRQSQQGGSNGQTCYSQYKSQVIANFQQEGLTWEPGMDSTLQSGAAQMPWINLGC